MKVAIFLDFESIFNDLEYYGLTEFDYEQLIDYLAETKDNRELIMGYSYMSLENDSKTSYDELQQKLKNLGFINRTKIIAENKSPSFEVELTTDLIEVIQNSKVDIVVIYSNNNDYAFLIDRIQQKGIRVEVTGFGRNSLKENALGFIDLTEAVIENLNEFDMEENNKEDNDGNN